ncbi:putative bifunctional diguanylate cyclase/phosphodiesterase [Enterovirga aerilata]|uniref:EAL domain-containing protein n=1 Tax=Enterovirga aerilata TaxID=2730920 RepID=A0A849I5M6_9HYPH|nr:EAL domain-containing protein [Enterovirga sp. DB1703]NNM72631.1 EAL domain-containing protein [Enterovirga sp. DB1703]
MSRLLWPTGVLFVATLTMVVVTFLWTSQNADLVAIDGQRARLGAGLDQRLESLRDEFAGFLARLPIEGADPTFGLDPAAVTFRGFDDAAMLSPSGFYNSPARDPLTLDRVQKLVAGGLSLRGTTTDLDRDGEPNATVDPVRQAIEARLLSDGEAVFAVLSARIGDIRLIASPHANDLVLAWKRLDGPILNRMGAIHGLKNLKVVPASRAGPSSGDEAVLPLLDGRGETASYIVWDPERPGDVMRGRLLPLLTIGLGFAALLFGAVALHFHKTTKNLAETDAISKELLGRDPLSGLANRMLFNERLDRELAKVAEGEPGLAVMFIDLDRFKDVNDAYGHQAGDELIRLVAGRLLNILPERDTLARLGGDEFAIIQTQVASFEEVEALCRRILDLLTRPFAVAHTQVTVGASIGVAVAPDHARDRESLMKLADTALYHAKSEGRNRMSFFQSRMDETLRMRKMVEDDLRRAIKEDQLVLYYQPLFSADGTRIVGLEALVRWPHPERGLISPTEFIAIAEERGLVIPLGEWVLRRACEDGKRWPNLRVAVNVSPIQFRHRGFVESVMRVLEETGFEPSRLELELTEGVVVGDADAAEAAMIDLRALGVHLALDDFGTGYSSLIYLRRFAFDKIKIDRSFLESMEATGESAILVHSIVHLGRALGLIVTAEGVETKEQHRFLQALGCHQLQGYLFSRPVPREEIDRMLGLQAHPEIPAADAA